MIAPVIYVIAVLLANYTAVWFIPLPFGLVAVGTLIFGVTFTQRDRTHKLGRPRVYTMIAITALACAVMSLTLGTPWRIIAASILAILLSEAADTEIYQRLLHRSWGWRVLSSNAVSVPLDSLIFNAVAFVGVFAWPVLLAIVAGEIVVKFVTGALWAVGCRR